MKDTNDAWNTCINQYIINGRLFTAKLVKGDNSVRYEIINNERELRDGVYPKPQSAFYSKSLCISFEQNWLHLQFKLSRIIQGKPMCTDYIAKQ